MFPELERAEVERVASLCAAALAQEAA